jgi:predicted GNAT family acetyltransferase
MRKLLEQDRKSVQTLLKQTPAMNLYMLGNLETLGFAADFCEFWGDFGADGTLRAVINHYMNGWALYGREDADWAALAAVLEDHPGPTERLQDNPGGVPSLLPWLTRYRPAKVREQQLMHLEAAEFRPQPAPAGVHVRQATWVDLDALIALYAEAGQMRRAPAAVARPLRDTRLFLAEEAGTPIAAALTNAETSDLAMIGGVYTPPAERGRGLSQAVCSALCRSLLDDGKTPVLYWDTPAAGAVYRKLGFMQTGTWRSVWLEIAAKEV